MMKRLVTGVFLVLLSAGVVSRAAYGVAMITLKDLVGGATVTLSDGDNDGVVTYVGAVGSNWLLNITSGISKPNNGSSATQPFLDILSANTNSVGAGKLQITFTDDNFGPLPAGSTFMSAIGGTTSKSGGGPNNTFTINFTTSLNSTPLTAIVPITGTAGTPQAWSTTANSGPIGAAFPYSLTEVVTIQHSAKGASSFDASLEGNPSPEPSAILLLGSGLAGLSYLRLKRRAKA